MVFLGSFANGNEWTTFHVAQGLTPLHWTVVAALWGVVISAVYMLRAFRKIFQGSANSGLFMSDPSSSQSVPLVGMAAVLLVVGCAPSLLLSLMNGPLAVVAAAVAR